MTSFLQLLLAVSDLFPLVSNRFDTAVCWNIVSKAHERPREKRPIQQTLIKIHVDSFVVIHVTVAPRAESN